MSNDPGQKYSNTSRNFVPTMHHDTYAAIDPTKADLKGKYVFITGASKGIGKAAALSFAKAGASGIALGGRSPLTSIVEETKIAAIFAGHPAPKILALSLDVMDSSSVDDAARRISTEFGGRFDVFVNNAGYMSRHVPLAETDPEDWWRGHEVNLKGPYLVTQPFFPLLMTSTHKVLLNISSIGALMGGGYSSAYRTSKLALVRFTEVLDIENGPQTKNGVVAIAAHPGGMKTELALHLPEKWHAELVDTVEERREWLGGRYVSVNWDVGELEARKENVLRGDLLKVRLAVNLAVNLFLMLEI
ncbi:oxidoreductase-like protein [Bimuria novae-zelandiae CBS 107.79]|uniref:Oxidoreductase-like protein n=1 Tax=Bimuria novae-zelandiae CBS 107.79 TaxID=1447943 RepID=A0A6A5VZR6_9PLEO|nr:oxidoreductase-like protein [Bimuria novae-zelandiae CBS 107.79]